MEIALIVPPVILDIIIECLDFQTDEAQICALPNGEARWMRLCNFKVHMAPLDRRADDVITLTTTIGPDDAPLLHSIKDWPAFIMAADLDHLDYQWDRAHGTSDAEDAGNHHQAYDDVICIREWARFGLVHRDVGYACQILEPSTNWNDYRYWVKHGVLVNDGGGPNETAVSFDYTGTLRDHQLWYTPAPDVVIRAGQVTMGKWGFVFSPYTSKMVLHRPNGPAHIQQCRDASHRQAQMETSLEGKYDPYCGPYPRAIYYLNGVNVTREDFAKQTGTPLESLTGPTLLFPIPDNPTPKFPHTLHFRFDHPTLPTTRNGTDTLSPTLSLTKA